MPRAARRRDLMILNLVEGDPKNQVNRLIQNYINDLDHDDKYHYDNATIYMNMGCIFAFYGDARALSYFYVASTIYHHHVTTERSDSAKKVYFMLEEGEALLEIIALKVKFTLPQLKQSQPDYNQTYLATLSRNIEQFENTIIKRVGITTFAINSFKEILDFIRQMRKDTDINEMHHYLHICKLLWQEMMDASPFMCRHHQANETNVFKREANAVSPEDAMISPYLQNVSFQQFSVALLNLVNAPSHQLTKDFKRLSALIKLDKQGKACCLRIIIDARNRLHAIRNYKLNSNYTASSAQKEILTNFSMMLRIHQQLYQSHHLEEQARPGEECRPSL